MVASAEAERAAHRWAIALAAPFLAICLVLTICLAVAAVSFSSLPVQADILRTPDGDDDILGGSLRGLMPDVSPQMTHHLCQQLRPYRPSPDLEYTPGVDARGRPVVPADLPGSAGTQLPLHQFDFPISTETLSQMGLPTGRLLPQGEVNIGWLSLNDGQLYFNGQPLTPVESGSIMAFCRTYR